MTIETDLLHQQLSEWLVGFIPKNLDEGIETVRHRIEKYFRREEHAFCEVQIWRDYHNPRMFKFVYFYHPDGGGSDLETGEYSLDTRYWFGEELTEEQEAALIQIGQECCTDPTSRMFFLFFEADSPWRQKWANELVTTRQLITELAEQGLIREFRTNTDLQYVGMTKKGQDVARSVLEKETLLES